MGCDIHVRVLVKNSKTCKWENIKLYQKEKGKIKAINLYPYRNYELFDLLNGNEDPDFPCTPINMVELPWPVYNEIKKDEEWYYGFKEVNLCELELYIKNNPKVRDYDYNSKDDEDWDKNGWKETPLRKFATHIENIIELADPYNIKWDSSLANVRIVYWFDS